MSTDDSSPLEIEANQSKSAEALYEKLSDSLFQLNSYIIESEPIISFFYDIYDVSTTGEDLSAKIKILKGINARSHIAAAFQSSTIDAFVGLGARTSSYPGILQLSPIHHTPVKKMVATINEIKTEIGFLSNTIGPNTLKSTMQGTDESQLSLPLLTRHIPVYESEYPFNVTVIWKARGGMRVLSGKNIQTRLAKALRHSIINGKTVDKYLHTYEIMKANYTFRIKRTLSPHPVYNISEHDKSNIQILGQMPLILFSDSDVRIKHLKNYSETNKRPKRQDAVHPLDLVFPELEIYATRKE